MPSTRCFCHLEKKLCHVVIYLNHETETAEEAIVIDREAAQEVQAMMAANPKLFSFVDVRSGLMWAKGDKKCRNCIQSR